MSKEPSRTLFEKVWAQHEVAPATAERPAIIYIDLHLVHEVTSPQAFAALNERGLKVARPERTKATIDHIVPTKSVDRTTMPVKARSLIESFEGNCRKHGIELFDLEDSRRGIVHVIAPEMGLTQPGMTIVCGDSHTTTHGAFGAWAFGIGTSEISHVLATQCVLQQKPKTFGVELEGKVGAGVTAKDIVLALIGKIGMDGATGYVLELTGSAARQLSMEARMTMCNMAIEAGARAGMFAPDDTTFEYVAKTPLAPKGAAWDAAVARWRGLVSDPGATYDRSLSLNVGELAPMISYGTSPDMSIPIDGRIPAAANASQERALAYMGLTAGAPLLGQAIDTVFIGSCTNSRISDLREAAAVMRGGRVKTRTLVVPGSDAVRREAESEGLAQVFKDAGAEWRLPGCSMCIAMNGDMIQPGQYAVSTSNRNFEGRQGAGGRTLLASPVTAAASALEGRVADPRKYIG